MTQVLVYEFFMKEPNFWCFQVDYKNEVLEDGD